MARVTACASLSILVGLVIVPAHAALVISKAATQNVTCQAGRRNAVDCYSTSPDAVLNVAELESNLTGQRLYVENDQSGAIVVAAPVHWATSTLLYLYGPAGIDLDAEITVHGQGSLDLEGGNVLIGRKGGIRLTKKTSDFRIGNHSYSLVATLPEMVVAASKHHYVALMNDYDASVDGTYSQAPVPGPVMVEGLGHRISNVRIVATRAGTSGNIGLFGEALGVSNLDVRHIDITVPGNISGGSVGAVAGNGTGYFRNVTVSGSVRAPSLTAGGFVGTLSAGQIVQSAAHVRVVGAIAGGLAGTASGTIQFSSASGNVTAAHATAGGLVGTLLSGNVDQSFATGNVATRDDKILMGGGLVGTSANNTSITNSYAFGTVTSTNGYLGGLIGFMEQSTAQSSYAIGATGPGKYAAGFVGHNMYGQITSGYWDTTTSGQRRGSATGSQTGLTGLSDMQLKSALPPGFNTSIWAQSAMMNNGYPYLIANPPQ